MGISNSIAEFVVNTNYDDIPKNVIETQKKSVMDAIAITMGASTLGDGCKDMVQLATEISGGAADASTSTVIGFDCKLPAVWAAFANGSMAHSLDFGDTQMNAVIHSNASTFPAALAVAEMLGNVSGKELLTALIIGSEVACRISLGVLDDLEQYGFYMPPIYTSFGATAAVCKLLGLSKEQVVDALSFNLCQTTCSSELLNNSDTVVRSIREAFAAKNAVISGLMAHKGLKGFKEPIEGKNGFYHAYARDNCDLERPLEKLGDFFESGELYFKMWPSCAGTHPVIKSILYLMEKHDINPAMITRVHIITSVRNRVLMEPENIRKVPKTPIIAKFSIPYTGALAILNKNVTINDFTEKALKDTDVLSMAAKFTYEVNENWGKADGLNTDVTIFTNNGNYHYLYTEATDNENNTSFDDIAKKFKSCAQYVAVPKNDTIIEKIIETVEELEALQNIYELTSLL